MKESVDLYDSHYEKVGSDVYREIRTRAFGEDLGQTSWITAEECDELSGWLRLEPGQRLLEVACGSGGVSVRMAKELGVSVAGIDIHEAAVDAATARAEAEGVEGRVEFHVADANDTLPFGEESFDAVFCNDSINHLRDRGRVLSEWYRVLRCGGRCLYTDPIVVTGCLSNDEIQKRSSIGFFLFTPPGVNEKLLRQAGFRVLLTADVTESVARTSHRWREARARRRARLYEIEGESEFQGLQDFLETVHLLAQEQRLSRFAYVGRREPRGP